jgi:hypothetical protein
VFRGNGQKKPDISEDTIGNRLKGSPCFLLAGDTVGNAPIRSPLLFGHHYSLCVAEKVSNTLQAFPKESPISLRYY